MSTSPLGSVNNWTPPVIRWWAAPTPIGPPGRLFARWLFLRALGGIYFSAFFSLIFQIRGLIGPHGLLPANLYLQNLAEHLGPVRYWYVPTLLWLGSSDSALLVLCWAGLIASVLVICNLWPRASLLVCFAAFLSFVAAAQDFSGYQSDGMLLSAGILAIFFAPPGFRPRFGECHPPARAPWMLLQFLWFTIYFESGVAKYLGGDPQWRDFTALYDYYQNGPLPTWIAWYFAKFPHGFQYSMGVLTLAIELALVFLFLFPRRLRILCFWIVTPFQIGLILTANYTFLNYLVLALGVLLLDDAYLLQFFPRHWAKPCRVNLETAQVLPSENSARHTDTRTPQLWFYVRKAISTAGAILSALLLFWIGYGMFYLLLNEFWPHPPLPNAPVVLLDGFRVANQYGLFGRMTRFRYEIEFQGSNDGGKTWLPYKFRFKPQDLNERPGIYAPYQPRFDWNLWFASLGDWRENMFVVRTEQQLLLNNPKVIHLFRSDPFPNGPPQQVRAMLWQYWFTDLETKRATGDWWRRQLLGLYAPVLERLPDGRIVATQIPDQAFPAP